MSDGVIDERWRQAAFALLRFTDAGYYDTEGCVFCRADKYQPHYARCEWANLSAIREEIKEMAAAALAAAVEGDEK